MATPPDFDVVIIGAGISGINTAYRVQSNFPTYKYCILEARDAIGGTWHLFKYPGIRSDSDLFTFGFEWHPWTRSNPIATGESILDYLAEATSHHGIDSRIRFHHRLNHASWSSQHQRWTLSVTRGASNDREGKTSQPLSLSARFVVFGTGYYDYSTPLQAHIPGIESFAGDVVHPQFWPEKLDYTDKKVVVIGSGATAVTLMPKLAEKARLATMLQRSPSYIIPMMNRSTTSYFDYFLPTALATRFKRLRWIVFSRLFYLYCTTFPSSARGLFRRGILRLLPSSVPYHHFDPSYDPWTQRLCVCPDGDFYKALHTGRADVVTGTIETVTPTGVRLHSGTFLDADMIVTATGLKLQIAGGATLDVDGEAVNPPDKFMWRGAMLQDVPNAAFAMGYTNASWTLGADATATTVVRMLRTLHDRGCGSVVPRVEDGESLEAAPLLNLTSTYLKRAAETMPKGATKGVFAPRANYMADELLARFGSLKGLEWGQEVARG